MSPVHPFASINELISLLQTRKWTYCSADESTLPIVSIVSSFFNAHQYFEATYQSIINQTWQNFEWIIVEDCSTDPDAIACFQSLSARSSKIRPLRHSINQGLSAGRNTAIAHAKGKYLFFMDLDDLIDPTYIEKCVLFLETHPEFSIVNAYSVGFQAEEYWWNHGFDQLNRFIDQNWVTGRLLYRKSDFDALGGFDLNLTTYEDWERWLRAIVNGQKGWTIPEYLDCYRRTNNGMLTTAIKDQAKNQQTISLIQSRYHHFFENNHFSNIKLKRDRFKSPIQSSFSIANPLKRSADKLHILCLFPHLSVGGADRFNLDLITLLVQRGYQFTIVTTSQSNHPWHQHFHKITPDIFHLPNFLEDSDWLAFTRYMIKSRQIDLIFISNSYIAYYFLPILRHEFPNVAFVDLTHTVDPGWRGTGYPRLSRQFSPFLDRQIVTSKFLANLYQPSEKLEVCYTNIDAELWKHDRQKRQKLRAKLKIAEDAVVLLFPARIVEQKRPLFLVDIVKALIEQTSTIAVVVVGNGELLPAMQARINQLAIESYFHILPAVSPTEMLDFYSAADILLLPSAYEGISLAIYEAMAMQLTIVASDVGGHTELVTPGAGFLIPKDDEGEQELQAYLQILLPLIQDRSLRDRVGDRARQRIIASFNLANMVNQMEAVFQQAVFQRAMMRHRSKPNPKVDGTAEEMLLMAIEYLNQQQALANLWQEKCQIEDERYELAWKKRAMESSKFWQLRRNWFKLKRWLRFTQEEEI